MPSTNSSKSLSVENWQRAGFGVYVHWPFCQAKCPYCDFNSHVTGGVDHDAWADALCRSLSNYAEEVGNLTVSSIFFGGGTPSLMAPKTVERVISEVGRHWQFSNDIEITLEANPTSVEASRFEGFRSAGVNRVSVGIQALNNADLKKLGRLHSVNEALQALETAQKTFHRVSFDLICARQDQTLKDWEAELQWAISLGTSHLSLYQLTIEPNTAFGARFARGQLRGLPSEDLSTEMFELTQDITIANGLIAYEVSNHAKPGQESRHNMIYWNGGDYVGIGPGAHGRIQTLNGRFGTEAKRMPSDWIGAIETEGSGETIRETISSRDQAVEYVLMSLRLAAGTSLEFAESLRPDLFNSEKIADFIELGLLRVNDRQLVATDKGRLVLNHILSEILA